MKTSEKIEALAAALSKAQAVMEGAEKSSSNPFFHSKYADLAEVWDACRKPLTDNGLSIVQTIDSEKEIFMVKAPVKDKDTGKVVGDRDVPSIWLTITSRLLHSSEQWIEGVISMPVEADPQAIGKVTTYLRRYAQMALCGIAPEDDDGESAAGRDTKTFKKPEPKAQDAGEHFCAEHKVKFFKTEKMKSYAHPIEGTKEWCHEHKPEPAPEVIPGGQPPVTPAPSTEAPPASKDAAPAMVTALNAQQRSVISALHKQKGLQDKLQANFIRERYKLSEKASMTYANAKDYIEYLNSQPDVEQGMFEGEK